MDRSREQVKFVNRRILPSHVAKYKFLFHDSCQSSDVFSKLQNGGSETSVKDGSCPFNLNDHTSVFFLKNGGAMSEGGGGDDNYGSNYGGDSNNYGGSNTYGGSNFGGDSNNYGGGGTFGGYSNHYGGGGGGGGTFGGDSNNYSNFYSSNSTQERDQPESQTSRLADVETYTYNDSTLPLSGRNSQSIPETPVVVTQPQPEKDDTQPSPPNSSDLANTNPYLEQDLAIHNSEDFPAADDKITCIDADSGCPDSILVSDSLNNQDNENNDGSLFHELSALNHTASEKPTNNSEPEPDSCGVDCLYFTLQCCECTIL